MKSLTEIDKENAVKFWKSLVRDPRIHILMEFLPQWSRAIRPQRWFRVPGIFSQ